MSSHLDPDERVDRTIDLLSRARDGDEKAWDLLYERYRDELHRRVRARLGGELRGVEDSMDVFQSVWREAIAGLENYEYRGEGSFLAWLATVLRNKLVSKVERLRTVKRGGGNTSPSATEYAEAASASPADDPGPSTIAERDEERELLLEVVERLPAGQRELVRWSLLEGLSNHEIGARLGTTAGAARMRVARASARLIAEVRQLRDEDPAGGELSGSP